MDYSVNSYLTKTTITFRFFSLIILLLLIAIIYFPGVNGGFYYDDFRPLSALTNVVDLDSALWYVFSETSGPLGRSISMLTFLFNRNDWPSSSSAGNPEEFFIFNIALHILNGLLVFILSYFITQLYKGVHKHNFWVAFTASALWLVLPIHVSTSLIAIQRMAGLSAFFVLFGLTVYVYGLHKQKQYVLNNKTSQIKNPGLFLQLIGVFLFTLLAMFSKENGILLPLFILVLEITLFAKVVEISNRRKLRISGGFLALFIVLSYLCYFAFISNNILPGREYTLIERLITQPQVLLEYVQLAFFPQVEAFNPFHDNYQPVKELFSSLKATASLIVVILSFIAALFYRKNTPILSFAILWFVSAHLLESTLLNLELYFEHRNYIALIGPCLAIALSIQKVPLQYAKIVMAISAIYWVLLAFNLFLTTKLWGNQAEAAHAWFIEQKGSTRASEHLSIILFNQNKLTSAQKVISLQVAACPNCMLSRVQNLFFSCINHQKAESYESYQKIFELISTTQRSRGASSVLAQLQTAISKKDCTLLNNNNLKKLNTALLNLPDSPYNNKIGFIQNLYKIAIIERNRPEAIRLLYLAWNENQEDYAIANELVSMLLAMNKLVEAKFFVSNELCKNTYWHPIIQNKNTLKCNSIKKRIETYTISLNNEIKSD